MKSEAVRVPLSAADRFGRQVAARLSDGVDALPYEVAERLRAARVQALARRKVAPQPLRAAAVVQGGGAAVLGLGDDRLSLGQRIAAALPLLALAAGLVLIHTLQDDIRVTELAEVDALLLTDDLPPAAYADPGFAQFLKTARE